MNVIRYQYIGFNWILEYIVKLVLLHVHVWIYNNWSYCMKLSCDTQFIKCWNLDECVVHVSTIKPYHMGNLIIIVT